ATSACASRSATAATLALRDRVAATTPEVSTRSRSSMGPFCRDSPTLGLPLLPDPGADGVQLGEEGQVEGTAQEVDAGRATCAGAMPDRALHHLQVPEPPQ